MDGTEIRRIVAIAALCAAVAAAVPGCSPRTDSSRESQSGSAAGAEVGIALKSPLEFECEQELLYLDSLIESRRDDPGFAAAALAEAVELKRTATELILEGDFELALELIDEAIALLA
jgi:hypothetical protein